jgi:hypothetical protein
VAGRFFRGGFRPGKSSDDGGIEEFPLFRDPARSSRVTRSCISAISLSRAAQPAQPGADGGRPVTSDHDRSRPTVIKATRRADLRKIT